MDSHEKWKLILLCVVLFATTAAVNSWQMQVGFVRDPPPPSANIASTPPPAASMSPVGQPAPQRSRWEQLPPPQESFSQPIYGIATVSDGQITTLPVKAGWSIRFRPIASDVISYDYFINGKLVHTADGTGFHLIQNDDRTEGWQLKPGHHKSVKFAYVLYIGAEPANWYEKALATDANR